MLHVDIPHYYSTGCGGKTLFCSEFSKSNTIAWQWLKYALDLFKNAEIITNSKNVLKSEQDVLVPKSE